MGSLYSGRARAVLVAATVLLAACSSDADRGYQALKDHRYGEALPYAEAALRAHPSDPYAQLNLAVVYQNLGQTEKARILYEAVLETGRGVIPQDISTGTGQGRSLAQIARDNLNLMDP